MEYFKDKCKLAVVLFMILFFVIENYVNGARSSSRRSSKVRLRGPPGMPGLPGPKGKRGWIGRPGRPGKMGDAGPPGMTGNSGVQGIEGTKGYQGLIGADGGVGPAGPPYACTGFYKQIDCAIGPVGYAGLPGMIGDKGKSGPNGHKGEMGNEGSIGSKGKRGRSGRPGSRGLLTDIECRTGRTKYARQMKFKRGRHSFGCNETMVEFLRGFEIETNGEKIRYKYKCCWFINVFK